MGLIHKIIQAEIKVLDAVVCDRCDKRIESDHDAHWNPMGEPYSNFFQPMFSEEFFVLKTGWGYHSRKDGDVHEAVLCESCYDEVFKDTKIKVKDYWTGESIFD